MTKWSPLHATYLISALEPDFPKNLFDDYISFDLPDCQCTNKLYIAFTKSNDLMDLTLCNNLVQ